MTDTEQTDTDPAVEQTAEVNQHDGRQHDDHDADPARAARQEAAQYRTRLRATEAERDRLSTQLDDYRRRDAETIAAERREGWVTLRSGADLWAGGVTLADVTDDDGAVSTDKVVQHVARLVEQRPHWRGGAPAGDIGLGVRGDPTRPHADWVTVLRGDAVTPGG